MERSQLEQGLTQRSAHIFRDAEGHFTEDTVNNRQQLINTAMDEKNYLGMDKWGNDWYAKSMPNGQQIWVQIRKGEIINGGINSSSRRWYRSTGLIQ